MSEESVSPNEDESVVVDVQEQVEAFDLGGLDTSLAPLRRLMRYCAESSDDEFAKVRFLEGNTKRFLSAALREPLPESVQAALTTLGELLTDVDGREAIDRRATIVDAYQALSRIDAVLGLPLPSRDRVRIAKSKNNRSLNQKRKEMRAAQAAERKRVEEEKKAVAVDEGIDEAVLDVAEDEPKKTRSRNKKGDENRSREERTPKDDRKSRDGRRSRDVRKSQDDRQKPTAKTDDKPIYFCGDWFGGRGVDTLDWTEDEKTALMNAGVDSILDLVRLKPIGFDTVKPVNGAGRPLEEGRVAVGGRVRSRITRFLADGTSVFEVVLWGLGPAKIQWPRPHPKWLINALEIGSRVVVVGDCVKVGEDEFVVRNPELTEDDGKHAAHLAQYGVKDVADTSLRAAIQQLRPLFDRLTDPLPNEVIKKRKLLTISEALKHIHVRGQKYKQAQDRMAVDEALLLQLGLMWPRFQGPKERGIGHSIMHGMCARLQQMKGFDLDDQQQRALDAIKRDLRKNTPMRRVLVGESSSGVGVVATLAAVTVAETRCQVMVVSPDKATAEQRFAFAETAFRDLGLVVRLMEDKPSDAQRDAVRRGEVHVIFGTQKLIEAKLEFKKLGLVVAGERHAFGGVSTWAKEYRAPKPDVLVVSATPIPQSVLLSAYPEWDISELIVETVPEVETLHRDAENRAEAYVMANESIEHGGQVLIVFPMGPEGDLLEGREAMQVVNALEQDALKGRRVGLFHGGMSRDERVRVYTDFQQRRLDVLVATTHFEAGPSTPGANIVIVEQADRMNVHRMHRIREWVAGRKNAKCVLITGEIPDENGLAAVKAMLSIRSGMELSQWLVAERGLKTLLKSETSHQPVLGWLRLGADGPILRVGREEAVTALDIDPSLKRGTHRELVRYLNALWPKLIGGDSTLNVAKNTGGRGRRRRRRRRN